MLPAAFQALFRSSSAPPGAPPEVLPDAPPAAPSVALPEFLPEVPPEDAPPPAPPVIFTPRAIYRYFIMKSTLIDEHNFWTPLLRLIIEDAEIKRKERLLILGGGEAVEEEENDDGIPNIPSSIKITPSEQNLTGWTASFVHCYPEINQTFIMHPHLPDATYAKTFWQMVYEQRSPTIIMVSNRDMNGFKYIPREVGMEMSFDEFSVVCIKKSSNKVICARKFEITDFKEDDQRVHRVSLYQFLQWHEHKPFVDDLMAFYRLIKKPLRIPVPIHNKPPPTEHTPPTYAPIIMSSSGMGRTGVIVISEVLCRMLEEKMVGCYNIENAIYELLMTNPYAVEYDTEFKMIYDIVTRTMEIQDDRLRKYGNDLLSFVWSRPPLQMRMDVLLTLKDEKDSSWDYSDETIQDFLKAQRKIRQGIERIQEKNRNEWNRRFERVEGLAPNLKEVVSRDKNFDPKTSIWEEKVEEVVEKKEGEDNGEQTDETAPSTSQKLPPFRLFRHIQ